ncbi:hypothetical protein BDFB_009311 [Asbolus verrucosus]|uniref:Uncharacterized protein n=1 Tax=Asbolus verrucosus TaxID=1661398 RepID=A0A482VYJ0_ASBVE|nr:hypothetical protein BDFB_009311 [Asbolus verrucosus]
MNINKSVHFAERLGPWWRPSFEVGPVIAVSVDGGPRVTKENRLAPEHQETYHPYAELRELHNANLQSVDN